MKTISKPTARLDFVDDFRGLIMLFMLIDHASFFLNRMWRSFDKFDPLFTDLAQFWLRTVSDPVAPGFLLVNGVMVWYLYQRRREQGMPIGTIRRSLIKRGIFLIALQWVWVNPSWSGFQELNLAKFGIIGCIGLSMCFTALLVDRPWPLRLALAGLFAAAYPAVGNLPYHTLQPTGPVQSIGHWLDQVFVTAGKHNSYPLAPWFATALLGTVIAPLWVSPVATLRSRFLSTVGLAAVATVLALAIRTLIPCGSEFLHGGTAHPSILLDQKYPPSLFFSMLWFAVNMMAVAGLIVLGAAAPWLMLPLRIVGRVPLFFYLIHIPVLALLTRRMGMYYREGAVMEIVLAGTLLFAVLVPICYLFERLKRGSKNPLLMML